MPMISIDDKEYDFDTLPQKSKDQLQSIRFVDAEVECLNANIAALKTARNAYLRALQESLINVPTPDGGDTLKLG